MLRRVVWYELTDVSKVLTASKTKVNFYETTRRNIPEDSHLHTRRRKNLEFHLGLILVTRSIREFNPW
jgi:hypothetical protein